jgi:hypothetical protein
MRREAVVSPLMASSSVDHASSGYPAGADRRFISLTFGLVRHNLPELPPSIMSLLPVQRTTSRAPA